MIRRALPLVYAVLLTLPLPTHAKTIHEKVKVIASFSIIADMVKEVAGDNVQVETLVPAGSDVHVFEPTPLDTRTIASADIIFVNGLGFEGWMDKLVQSADAKGQIIPVSKGVTPITVDGEIDPHAWQDLSNGMIYVDTIRDALIKADPSNAGIYRNNANRYLKQLIELDRWAKMKIDELPASSRKAITNHDALRYFERTYHINLIPAQGISTEGQVSAGALAAIIDQIRKDNIKALFLENMNNPDLIQQLAQDSGAIIGGTLYSDSLSTVPGENNYISMFRHNVNTIIDALKK